MSTWLWFWNSKRRLSEGESIKVMSYNGMTRDKVFEVIQNFEANPNESRSTDTLSCQSLRKISTVSLLSDTLQWVLESKIETIFLSVMFCYHGISMGKSKFLNSNLWKTWTRRLFSNCLTKGHRCCFLWNISGMFYLKSPTHLFLETYASVGRKLTNNISWSTEKYNLYQYAQLDWV